MFADVPVDSIWCHLAFPDLKTGYGRLSESMDTMVARNGHSGGFIDGTPRELASEPAIALEPGGSGNSPKRFKVGECTTRSCCLSGAYFTHDSNLACSMELVNERLKHLTIGFPMASPTSQAHARDRVLTSHE